MENKETKNFTQPELAVIRIDEQLDVLTASPCTDDEPYESEKID